MKVVVSPNLADHKSSDIQVGKDLPTKELAVFLLGYPSNNAYPLLWMPIKQLRILWKYVTSYVIMCLSDLLSILFK